MAEDILDIAPFLPPTAPRTAVKDFSGLLSSRQINYINTEIGQVHQMTAKIVVLPRDFHVENFEEFCNALAEKWHVEGSRMLMVVDMKDHHVRILVGKDLEARGVTPQVITQDILPNNFYPNMRKHDLPSAITMTVNAIDERAATTSQTKTDLVPSTSSRGNETDIANPPPADAVNPWLIYLAVLVAIGAGIWGFSFHSRKQANRGLKEAFEKQVNALYQAADQIGQASEYLKTSENQELAQRIATFFNRLGAMQEAVNEVDRLTRQNKVWAVRDGYLNLRRMSSILEPEAEQLKKDLDTVTGGVNSLPATGQPEKTLQQLVDKQKQQEEEGQYIRIPDRLQRQQELQYARPSWSYEPVYYQPVASGIGGLAAMTILMDQMENQRIGQLESEWRYEHARGSNQYDGGNTWNSPTWGGSQQETSTANWNDASNAGSADWSDSSGTSSTDFDSGGGSWDSGTSGGDTDSGSSGADFDSGGGDW